MNTPTSEPQDAELLHRRVDTVVEASARPVSVGSPAFDRLTDALRAITATPRRASLATVWGFAFVLMCLALIRTTAVVMTEVGRSTVRCGLDSFVLSYPDRAVTAICRHAEAPRLALFLPSLLSVLAGCAVLVAQLLKNSARSAGSLVRTKESAARSVVILSALGAATVLAAGLALRPATTFVQLPGGLAIAHCGIDSYLRPYPDAAISHACRRADGARGISLLVSVLALILVVGSYAWLMRRRRSSSPSRLARLAIMAGSVALAVVALLPVTVAVNAGPAPVTASCGLDTFLAGYPDPSVQTACRSHYSRHALVGLAALLLAGVSGLCLRSRRQSRPEDLVSLVWVSD